MRDSMAAFFVIAAVMYALYSGSARTSHTRVEILVYWPKLEIRFEKTTGDKNNGVIR